MDGGFEAFSIQHYGALSAGVALTWGVIRYGRAGDIDRQVNLAIVLAGLTFSSVLVEALLLMVTDRYVPQTDLPLYLCDLVAIALPFVLYYQNRKWIGIFYFWALAGTLQALVTPDIEHGFPSFAYFKYFFTHTMIVVSVIYTVVVWHIRIGWRDFGRAILYAQVYLAGVHLVNVMLGSNFSYTLQKPPGPSLLDLLGPWPWYILWGEGLMVVLFLLLLLPFVLPGLRKDLDMRELTGDGDDQSG